MGNCSGAQDSNAFVASISQNYQGSRCTPLPDSSTLTYEGVFNEHLFHAGPPEQERACAATLFTAISEGSPWLAIWLKSSMDGAARNLHPIELSVVIDVSGSMSWGMMDGSRTRKPGESRIEYAMKAVATLLRESLRPDDSLAISTFNQQGVVLQPLTKVSDINTEECLEAVCNLQPGGGTTLSAGMDVGRSVFEGEGSTQHADKSTKRILFLTDMDDMSSSQLGEQIKRNAAEEVYVSIVGMGVAFNSQLTDTVTKNKGSNYFCVTNEAQLRQCVLEDFAFNFFPCAFEINVYLRSGSLSVHRVFGTPFDTTEQEDPHLHWSPTTDALYPEETRKQASQLSRYLPSPLVSEVVSNLPRPIQSVTEINTLFPSRLRDDGAMKGGLILVQLATVGGAPSEGSALQVTLEYEDLQGVAHTHTQDVNVPEAGDHFSTSDPAIKQGLQKGLLLQRYAQICRKHMDLVNSCANPSDGLEKMRQQKDELACASNALNAEVDAWTDRCVQFVGDDKMDSVAQTFGSFAGLFERAAEDKKKEFVGREEWESGRLAREAKIDEERAVWEAQQAPEGTDAA